MDSKPQAPPSEGAAYPRMSPEDLAPPPPPVVAPAGSNPYVLSSPSSGPPAKSAVKTGPSITDAAMGRIAQVSKVISEGGYDKIFQQTFECLPDEKLKKAYACYLSTSHGPIMGVLYVSTAKLAFCSDSPVAYVTEDNQTASAIYKIVVPVPHLRSVTPTASQQNPAERYIQVVSVDNHDFWFMGFVNYDSAVKCLQDAARGGA
ncbi:unnamed protein product [Triticum turgidum subsp. durum]|uniref:GRAM domain-containing protein n=1 Tax=Triticum turgidum subsp. durum TaxID=4567 RepID=A0A9R1PHR7_TRITD|nr:unnamed protein product [Triticum turgidum subsp. durum]